MKKRISIYGLSALFLVLSVFSCKQQVVRQSVIGCVADATMNHILVVTNTGDTLNVSTMDSDPAKVPGVLINDSVLITYVNEKVDGNEILKAEKLTITAHSPSFYIQGTWVEPNPINPSEMQGVILNEDGSASSVGMHTLLFEKWELDGNKLMLTSKSIGNKQTLEGIDTLLIVKLDADSLVLSNDGNKIWQFGKKK